MKKRIADIKVGVRMRKDFGDLELLAASMTRLGQLQAIIIDEDDNLIAGERRLRAAQLLGWEEIEVAYKNGCDDLTKKECELEENLRRKEFNWPEEVLALEQLYRLKQEKYGTRTPGTDGSQGFGIKDAVNELDRAAGTISMDLQLAAAIRENPELCEEKTKSSAFKRWRREKDKKLREAQAKRATVAQLLGNAPPSPPTAHETASATKSASDSVLAQLGVGSAQQAPVVDGKPEAPVAIAPPKLQIRKAIFDKGILFHGDSRIVLKSLPSQSIDCIVTDPPYALALFKEGDTTSGKRLAENQGDMYDDDPHKVFEMLDLVMHECARVLKPKGHAYFFFHHKWYEDMHAMLDRHFGEGTCDPTPICWIKNTPGIGDPNERWVYGYEPFLFVNRGRPLVKPQGFNYLRYDTVPPGQKKHPTEKPMMLLRHIISASCVPGEVVLDPFMGSASTIHAAVDLDCRFVGIELKESFYRQDCDRIALALGEENKDEGAVAPQEAEAPEAVSE